MEAPPLVTSKRKVIGLYQRQGVVKLYKSLIKSQPNTIIEDIITQVAFSLDVSRASVYNIIRLYKKSGKIIAPSRKRNRYLVKRNLNDSEKIIMRNIVYNLYETHEIPKFTKIFEEVNKHPKLPIFKRSTFYRLIKDLGFKFEFYEGCNASVIENDEVILARRKFLRDIRRYRAAKRSIYYIDETVVSRAVSTRDFAEQKAHFAIVHIGNENGFFPGGLAITRLTDKRPIKNGEKRFKDSEYAMTEEFFENWFNNIFVNISPGSVVVLDNASCHCRKKISMPTAINTKEEIKEFLTVRDIAIDNDSLKIEMLQKLESVKDEFDKYVIDELAKLRGIVILRIPDFLYSINPFESVWQEVKSFIEKNDSKIPITDLVKNAVKLVTPDKWKNYVENVINNEETKLWKLDQIIEDLTIHDEYKIEESSEDDVEAESVFFDPPVAIQRNPNKQHWTIGNNSSLQKTQFVNIESSYNSPIITNSSFPNIGKANSSLPIAPKSSKATINCTIKQSTNELIPETSTKLVSAAETLKSSDPRYKVITTSELVPVTATESNQMSKSSKTKCKLDTSECVSVRNKRVKASETNYICTNNAVTIPDDAFRFTESNKSNSQATLITQAVQTNGLLSGVKKLPSYSESVNQYYLKSVVNQNTTTLQPGNIKNSPYITFQTTPTNPQTNFFVTSINQPRAPNILQNQRATNISNPHFGNGVVVPFDKTCPQLVFGNGNYYVMSYLPEINSTSKNSNTSAQNSEAHEEECITSEFTEHAMDISETKPNVNDLVITSSRELDVDLKSDIKPNINVLDKTVCLSNKQDNFGTINIKMENAEN